MNCKARLIRPVENGEVKIPTELERQKSELNSKELNSPVE